MQVPKMPLFDKILKRNRSGVQTEAAATSSPMTAKLNIAKDVTELIGEYSSCSAAEAAFGLVYWWAMRGWETQQ